MDAHEIASVGEAIASWAKARDVVLERQPPAEPYWFLRVKGAPDGGTISVSFRANEHGPIEVAPSNDMGWFERYGCTRAGLVEVLELARGDVFRWSGDPWQGMP